MKALFLLVATTTLAVAGPAKVAPPSAQALACPNAEASCDLELAGKLVSSRRHAKWDALRIETVRAGRRATVNVSINIPHRKRLALEVGARYRLRVAASQPFEPGDLWVVEARRLE